VTSSSAAGEHRPRGGSTRIRGPDLAAVLHGAVREALRGLDAVAAAVYLLDEESRRLRVAMIGGSPPSFFTLPGHIDLDAPYASARAVATGKAAAGSEPSEADQPHVLPYPYAVLAAPVIAPGRRFGALTVLRLDSHGAYEAADRTKLQELGDDLAAALAGLAEAGTAITAGPTPVVGSGHGVDVCTPGWGVSGVPGSAGMSLMYALRRLGEMLNQATTMDHVVAATRYYVMAPFRARALALASASEGRLWILGHSGASSGIVRTLHGAGLDARTPAAQAVRGRPLFLSGGRQTGGDTDSPDGERQAEAYLPLIGGRQVIEFPRLESRHVVGVCCLSFPGPRDFPPEERAVLSMMADMLGAAVERVELSTKQREAAEYLQRTLLPPTLLELPRLTTTARYRPATVTSHVGGDWYDVLRLPDEQMVLVVGDVEGHGMESAAVMGQVRTAGAAYASEGHHATAVLDRIGRLLAQLGSELLVTCCIVALDTADGTADVALAGHPEPLILRPDGSVGCLDAPANLPLGVTTQHAYGWREHTVEPGSVLMLYSDGLVDRHASDPEAYARTLLATGSREAGGDLEQLADNLMTEAHGPQQRRDDAVLLLARYEGALGKGGPQTGRLQIQRRDLHGVKAARSFVDDRLRSWELTEMSDALQLVVSEIVTNALIHAGSDVDVRLRAYPDHVRLEVRDCDSNPPVPSPVALTGEGNAEAEHGRGLLIVEALASTWSTHPNGRGKTVSVDLPVPDL
jgi:GAF domain-containing protein/anti-sigma regulatory factor (Ser/Thr protein kinase)